MIERFGLATAVVVGTVLGVAAIALAILSARADGRVDYCYLETNMHDSEAISANRKVYLKGHRKWSFDITLWSERIDMNNSIHGMELINMAASQFCPDGKVH